MRKGVREMSSWIAVDLDGTLAEYHGWVNTFHIGPPIPAMVARVKAWLAGGKDVRIFTARVDGAVGGGSGNADVDQRYRDVDTITKMIQDWCEEHVGARLPVTCKKDYGMVELWDDRCVQVIPNTGVAVRDLVPDLGRMVMEALLEGSR